MRVVSRDVSGDAYMVEVWVDGAQRVCQARGPNLDDFARIAVLDGAHGAEAHEWVGSVGRAPDRFECERGRLAAEQLDGGRARQPRRVGVFGKIHECAGRIGGAVPPAPDRLAVVRRTEAVHTGPVSDHVRCPGGRAIAVATGADVGGAELRHELGPRHPEAVVATITVGIRPARFEEGRAYLAACGVFRLSDYLDEVVQPLWPYWALDRCASQNEETRKAHAQLRRYRAALRRFARSERQLPT